MCLKLDGLSSLGRVKTPVKVAHSCGFFALIQDGIEGWPQESRYGSTFSPYKNKSCSAIVTYFRVLFLILSLSLLKVSLQKTPYAIVEFAKTKTIFVPSNTQPLIGERVWWVLYPPSGQRQTNGEKISSKYSGCCCKIASSIMKMRIPRMTYLCCKTWTWVYMVARLAAFLTPCWVTYWELRR